MHPCVRLMLARPRRRGRGTRRRAGGRACAAPPRRRSMSGVLTPPLSPRNASYTIAARLDPATRTITGIETITWRNITAAAGRRSAVSPVLERVEEHALDLHARARARRRQRRSARRADEWAPHRRHRRSSSSAGADRIAASQRFIAPDDDNAERRDGDGGAAAAADRAGRSAHASRSRGPRTCRAPSRAPAPSATSSSSRSGFRSSACSQDEGWNCHQFHAGTEFFSDYGIYDVSLTVPAGWTVGATGVAARAPRQRATARRRTATTRKTCTTSRGRRARTTSSGRRASSIRRCRRSRCACCCSPSTPARPSGTSTRRARRCKYYGEWFGAYPYGHITIVDPAYQSGAGGMEYPTLFTAGTRWLAPARRRRRRKASRCTKPATSSGTASSATTSSRTRGWTKGSTRSRPRARSRRSTTPNYLALRYFGGFMPWVFKDSRSAARPTATGLPATGATRKSDAQSTPTLPLLPGDRRQHHLQQDGAVAEHDGALARMADAAAHHVDAFRTRGSSSTRSREISSTIANEVAGRDLARFFDQVYRSSNVFDYGVAGLEERRATAAVSDDGRRAALRRGDLSGGRARHVRQRRACHRTLGRRAIAGSCTPTIAASPARSAQVDPNRVLLLDVNYTNNSKTLRAEAATRRRRSGR